MTVLFADLVGFTPLADKRDAEEVRELLSRYFDRARTVIRRYGGIVEKFIGDAVMAVWGAPTATEDGAERAVRAGLELVDAVVAFGSEIGAPGLQARAGVMTGEVAVNVGTSGEGMVAGDLVNTASRVQSAAEPGMVYVGDTTRQVTEAAIVYEDAGEHVLKGKPEPLRLWRAARVVAARGGALRPSSLEAPFVGRERELRVLKDLLHATGAESSARLLSILGVAGVGKSRLAWEFFKYLDGLTERIYWHRGRCLAYGEGVAYSALGEMVRMRAGIVENEPSDSAREKLHRCVVEFVGDEEQRRWVEPRLAHLLALEEVSMGDPRDLYAAWRFFFERLAARCLTVLVFEDLQWADGGLLDFIEYLLDWSRSSPILVLTLARPELTEHRPGWGAGKRGLASLYLDPLSSEAMGQLLAGLVPGLPEDLAARILERAAGIPLYAVETVRMLLDRGLLVEQEHGYRLEGSVEALEVPESLHALVAARLDNLSVAERQLLQDASVLGKSFTPAALSAVTRAASAEVPALLAGLLSKDLLAIQSDPRSPERGQYVFVQDLVRSVAYATLARRECKLRHLAAAGYLENAWSEEEEIAEVVAAHLVAAYEAAPDAPDAAEIRDRAIQGLIRAGDHAASLSAPASAQRYFEQALALVGDDRARAELHLSAGRAAVRRGRGSEARAHLRQAADLFAVDGPPHQQALALNELATLEFSEGFSSAIARSEEALQILAGSGSEEHQPLLGTVEGSIGRMLYFTGDLQKALTHVERSLQIAEDTRSGEVLARSLDTKAAILAAQGRTMEAEVLMRGALSLALDNDLTERAASTCASLATTLEGDERLEASLDIYEQGQALAERLGDRKMMWGLRLNRIGGLLELGRWDTCRSILEAYTKDDAAELNQFQFTAVTAINAVWLHLRQGDLVAARGLLEATGDVLRHSGVEALGLFDAARAALAGAEGDPRRALGIAEPALAACIEQSFFVPMRMALIEAVEAAFALGSEAKVEELIGLVHQSQGHRVAPSVDALIHRWTARLLEHRHDLEGAEGEFRLAIDAFAGLGRPFWLAVSRLELAELLLHGGRTEPAEELLGLARATFAELGAPPWLDRTDRARQPEMARSSSLPA